MEEHFPDFLREVASEVRAFQRIPAADGFQELQHDWRAWTNQASRRLPGLLVDEPQATACLGDLSPGCRACKDGVWDCIFVTMRCNAQCAFCCSPTGIDADYSGSAFGASPETVAANYTRTEIRGVSFSGGEPLTAPERLFYWIAEMRRRLPEHYLWIYTNGLLLTGDLLRELARLRIDEIRFNAAAAGYDTPLILENMRRAAGAVPRITVEIPAVPDHCEPLLRALPAWSAVGVRHLNLHELMFEPETPSDGLPGQRNLYLLPDGHATAVHPGSRALVLDVLETVAAQGLPLAVNYCSLYNKVHQVSGRRRSLLPLTQTAYEKLMPGDRLESCVVYRGSRHDYCHPDRLDETLARNPGYAWARLTRAAPLSLQDRGRWLALEFGGSGD